MSKRTKINFKTINKDNFEIIPTEKIAETNSRIKKEMKKKRTIRINKKRTWKGLNTSNGREMTILELKKKIDGSK